jgi:hypothetical protein
MKVIFSIIPECNDILVRMYTKLLSLPHRPYLYHRVRYIPDMYHPPVHPELGKSYRLSTHWWLVQWVNAYHGDFDKLLHGT